MSDAPMGAQRAAEVEVARGDRNDLTLEPDPSQGVRVRTTFPTDADVRNAQEHSAGAARLNNPAMPTAEAVAEEQLPSAWEALDEDGAAHRRE
jgi:hypothetical protein